jgi:F-type H+-transporting ATPase subunit b
MVDLNFTLFIQLANFLVLILVLNRILYRPLLRVLEERRQKTEGLRARAAEVEENGDEIMATYEVDIAAARGEGRARINQRAAEAEAEGAQVVEAAKGAAQQETDAVLAALQERRQRFSEEMASEVPALARQIAAKVLGRAV